jgi:hypothetical protein
MDNKKRTKGVKTALDPMGKCCHHGRHLIVCCWRRPRRWSCGGVRASRRLVARHHRGAALEVRCVGSVDVMHVASVACGWRSWLVPDNLLQAGWRRAREGLERMRHLVLLGLQ